MACGRHILQPPGMHRRQADRGADLTGKIQMRGARHALNGHYVSKPGISIDMTANDIQKINHPGIAQALSDAQTVLATESALEHLVGNESNTHNELWSHPLTNRL